MQICNTVAKELKNIFSISTVTRRIRVAFLCLLLLLFFSGAMSLFELGRVSHDTEEILLASKENVDLAGSMLTALNEQNDIMITLAVAGATFISATSPVSFTNGLYESISALATVGLTAGVTTSLAIPAKILIIFYMYFGRVGVLTLSLGFLMGDKAQERFRYANTNLLIG